jgi:hypothetical protein
VTKKTIANDNNNNMTDVVPGCYLRERRPHRQGRRRRRWLACLLSVSFIGVADTAAGNVWEPLVSIWTNQPSRHRVAVDEPKPPITRDSAISAKTTTESRANYVSTLPAGSTPSPSLQSQQTQPNKKGWFFARSKKVVEPPTAPDAAARQNLIEDATAALLQRQEALQQEATKVMAKIESMALAKGSLLQDGLIEHANVRQQELAAEVERLSAWTERLLDERAQRLEEHARATLQTLDRAVVEEGRRIKLMGMALAESTIRQAEEKALEGLTALEQNAMDQVVKLGSHVLESLRTGKKKPPHHYYTAAAILQRTFSVGQGESNRLLVLVRSSAIFLAILLAISPPYWDRLGGNAGLVSIVPQGSGLAGWLLQPNRAKAIRPAASAVCALSAILVSWRISSSSLELLSQRAGALLLLLMCRVQTVETTIMSMIAIAFLLTELPRSNPTERRK